MKKTTKLDLFNEIKKNYKGKMSINPHTLNSIFEVLKTFFLDETKEAVVLSKFGVFRKVRVKNRLGRNPKTLTLTPIPAHITIKFRKSPNNV